MEPTKILKYRSIPKEQTTQVDYSLLDFLFKHPDLGIQLNDNDIISKSKINPEYIFIKYDPDNTDHRWYIDDYEIFISFFVTSEGKHLICDYTRWVGYYQDQL